MKLKLVYCIPGNNMLGFTGLNQKYKNTQRNTVRVTSDYAKFSQSLFRIQTRTRSRRHCGGVRPRRLTKTLQPSSRCPTGEDRSHRSVDCVPTSVWCECERDTRQVPDRVCFSSLNGSNPRSTSYSHMSKQNRAVVRP